MGPFLFGGSMITLKDRILGSCYGAIFGDIVGAYNEFLTGSSIRKITMDMLRTECDVFRHPFGHFTDDTSCSLITMDAYDGSPRYDSAFFMKELRDWRDNGAYSSTGSCFDIGGATSRAIDGNPNTDESTGNGNGALMRMAPVCISSYVRKESAAEVVQMAELTHPVVISTQMCIKFFYYMFDVLEGKTKSQLRSSWNPMDIYSLEYTIKHQKKPDDTEVVPYPSPTGYVVDTLYWAVKVFLETDSYLEGLIRLAEMGDDSDTVCCVYGSLAGAYYGMEGVEEIPQDLRDRLVKKSFVDDTINRFVDKVLK